MSDKHKRQCSTCNKVFGSRVGCDNHIRDKHDGVGERIAAPRKKEREPSMGDMFVEAQMNRAMGIKNDSWIEDMLW